MIRSLCVFLCLCGALIAADVTGKWTGQMGEGGREVVFDLKQDGTKISGTMSGPNGEPRKITGGSLTGDDIDMTVASEWQGSPVTLKVKGKVSGSEMKLRIESEGGDWGTGATVKKSS
jgi:hypothetical protein